VAGFFILSPKKGTQCHKKAGCRRKKRSDVGTETVVQKTKNMNLGHQNKNLSYVNSHGTVGGRKGRGKPYGGGKTRQNIGS